MPRHGFGALGEREGRKVGGQRKAKRRKAPGPDEMPMEAMLEMDTESLEEIRQVLNHFFETEQMPEGYLRARVVLIFKKGQTQAFENYRPISLLSSFHKVIEKIVKEKVLNFLNNNKILYKYQFGFRKSYSTNLALLDVVENLYANLNVGNNGLGIYLDLQKAFDTVDHDILLAKLSH